MAPQQNTRLPVGAPRAGLGRFVLAGIVILLVGLALLRSTAQVNTGEVGIVSQFGAVQSGTLAPGIHVVLPFVQTVEPLNVQIQKEQVDVDAASSDLQSIRTQVALNWHPDAAHAADIFRNVGMDYKSRLVDPAIQEAIKAATAKYTAEQLITNRAQVNQEALGILTTKLARSNLVVTDLNITNFAFSDAFNQAIEAKQVAQQNVLKAQQELARAKVAAQQKVAQANADAEATVARAKAAAQATLLDADAAAKAQELQRRSLSPLYLQSKALDVQARALDKWNGQLPSYMTGGTVPFLQVPAPASSGTSR
jgi:regulator of protease activity HflC (stomatin/prohibitin superfamily)